MGNYSPSNNRPDYIPSLDGFRALAVLMVIIAHCGIVFVPGGFGVTIFFFMSGFLITTLLIKEIGKNGRIDIKMFYLRRLLRLAPPLL